MANWTDCGIPFSEAEDEAAAQWGPPPAEVIAEGKQRLIARLYRELDRHPSATQVDEETFGPETAPEMIEAIAGAAEVFRRDLGRNPTEHEVLGGLLLDDTDDALLIYLEREIQVGDRVIWPERDAEGNYLHHTIDGRELVVSGFGTVTAQPDGWHGDNVIASDDGRTVVLGRKWLRKQPTG